MRNLQNLTTQALWGMIEDLAGQGQEMLVKQCEILYELYKRKEKHPLHKGKGHLKMYRHFEAIALGKITPALVAYLKSDDGKVTRFSGYRTETQKLISDDIPFTVAIVDPSTGEIIKWDKLVRKMSEIEIDMVFPGNGHIATFSEQVAKLKAISEEHPEALAKPKTVTAHSANAIKVRNYVVTIDELKAALAGLGYDIVKK